MCVKVQNVEVLDRLAARIRSFLQMQGGETGRGIERALRSSHHETWVTLKKLEKLTWIEYRDHKYCLTERAGMISIYDPRAALLFTEASRRLLLAINDYGPLSSKEAGLLTGLFRGTTARQMQKLKQAGLIVSTKAGAWALSPTALEPANSRTLWPPSDEKLTCFVDAAKKIPHLIALVLSSYPVLDIAAVTGELEPEQVYAFGEQIAGCLSSCELRPRTLLIASKHAWLHELHRIHYPPAIKLRNALLGFPLYGEKPRHDYAALYQIYTNYAPLAEGEIKRWKSKSWITRTANGRLAFSPVGVECTRRLRQFTKVFKETMPSDTGIEMEMYFA